MNTKRANGFIGVVVLIFSGVAFGQTQVPNTFQSGQPARASEVNDNFSTLETAVNTNATNISAGEAIVSANTLAITAVVAITIPRMKSNGQDIGSLLDGTMLADFVAVLSNTGYTFQMSTGEQVAGNTALPNLPPGTIKRQKLWYATTNCTGQAYVGSITLNQISYFGNGAVIASENWNDPTGIYYSPKGSTFIPGIIIRSKTEDQGLQAVSITEPVSLTMDVIEVFPNDPQITGVTSQRNYDPPITLDVQTVLVHVPPP